MEETKTEEKKSEEDDTNLWGEFLAQQSGTRTDIGHLIVLGSPGCGKTSLVGQFGRLEGKFGEMKKFLMMRYSYVHLSDANSSSHKLLNIWQISEPEHCAVVKEVVPPNDMERVAWLIVLDASQPWKVKDEFEKWSKAAITTQEELLSRAEAATQGNLKDKIFNHVQYYVNPNDAEAVPVPEEEKAQMELNRSNPPTNIGAPIVVVLTKIDAIKSLYPAEAQANSYYDILVQYVRLWCLELAAASFSMAGGLKDQARRILSYLDHRIFDTKFERGPSAVVSVTNMKEDFLFIPSGFDTNSIIESQAGKRNLKDPFENYFKPQKSEEKEEKRQFVAQADNDVTFLKRLAWDLDRASEKTSKKDTRPQASTISESSASGSKKSHKDQEAVQKFFNRLLQTSGNG